MTYDEMILRGPDEPNEIGTEDGDTCGRFLPPDEDAPRGYKPKPCKGVMIKAYAFDDGVACNTCGEIA